MKAMTIAISECLVGENCKYNGGNNYRKRVLEYIKGCEVIPICPEVMGGLPIPREPSEIVDGIVKHRDGTSVDKEFHWGAAAAYDAIIYKNVDCVILQPRSPSCGVHSIYDGTFSGRIIPGEGVFARLLREKGIRTVDVEDFENTIKEERTRHAENSKTAQR